MNDSLAADIHVYQNMWLEIKRRRKEKRKQVLLSFDSVKPFGSLVKTGAYLQFLLFSTNSHPLLPNSDFLVTHRHTFTYPET
jgi:hypothetical protein